LKFLRADGDGIFGRSASFRELAQAEGFIHEKPAPYDHEQNALVDRECRSLLEAVNTSLYQSGAPSNFWGEAANHYTFTRNNIPRHEISKNGKTVFISPNNMFEGVYNPFSLKHLVAFGTQATCYIPPERREGRKTPGQARCFDGVIIGYVDGCAAYHIWDLEARKIKEVSFYFTVVSEGFFPFRDRKNWPDPDVNFPFSFYPTFESLLRPEESFSFF
jgi:hypothetical protein